jgi:hypothetical protein
MTKNLTVGVSLNMSLTTSINLPDVVWFAFLLKVAGLILAPLKATLKSVLKDYYKVQLRKVFKKNKRKNTE